MVSRICVFILVLVGSGLAQVSVKVETSKPAYLVGEPVFVIVKVTNIGTESLAYSYSDGSVALSVEKAAKKQRANLWGCYAGSAGGGMGGGTSHPPLLPPNKSISFQYLLKGYRLGAGDYALSVKGKAGVRWKYYPEIGPNTPPAAPRKYGEADPVPGASFDVVLPITLTSGSREDLERAYATYISDAEGFRTGTEEMRRAREAIAEMAPEFLEKTIAGFATAPIRTPELAVAGLEQIDTDESRADLVALYDTSTDLNLRNQIVEALAGIATGEETEFFAGLLPGRSTVADDRIRQWATLGLGHIGGDDAVRALATGLSSPNDNLRMDVAVALGNTKSKSAVPLLIQMYSDHGDGVRNQVCGALKQLTHHEWCDGSGTDAKIQQARWLGWWKENGVSLTLYGSDQCPKWDERLPTVP